jgi:DNA-binding CsgD family transcriptional regulator
VKNISGAQVINQFSALSTTFGAAFESQTKLPRRKINLTVSTVYSNHLPAKEDKWLESLLEIWHQGAIVIDENENILQATEFTERMLDKYFLNSENEVLPTKLKSWVDRHTFSAKGEKIETPAEPLVINLDGDELRIRIIIDNRVKRKTVMFREVTQLKPIDLMALGLTKREAEVLFLIAKGKTNPEIGILLDISTRTVQKHVEHIYIKLGIETRTAAMLRVNELNPNMSL